MSTVSIQKNSPEGQLLCTAAEQLGIDPASLLSGICINATRNRAARTAGEHQQTVALPAAPTAPAAPAAAPTTGLLETLTA